MAKKEEVVTEEVTGKEEVVTEEVTGKEEVVEETTEKIEEVSKTAEETNASAETATEDLEKSKTETKTVKLKVLIPFTDKETKEHYKLNDEITVSKKRAEELLADKRKLVTK